MKRICAASVLLALAVAACGGGGGKGGGGGVTEPPPPTKGIVFTAGSGSASNGVALAAESGPATTTTLTLDVRASQVTNLYGFGFNLTYPTNVLKFTGASEGSFLNSAGSTATSYQATENPAGTIVIGISRLGTVAGASGSGVLTTLHFSAVASGTGTFTFSHNAGFDSNGVPIGLGWAAGSVQVTE
jgi:hypothetical protein